MLSSKTIQAKYKQSVAVWINMKYAALNHVIILYFILTATAPIGRITMKMDIPIISNAMYITAL